MREKPAILDEQLRACFQEQYDLIPVTLEFLPVGLDYNAGVYRVVSEHGNSYLLKVKSGSLYEPGYLVPRYLQDQGIAEVVAPLPTKRNTLWTWVGTWRVIVYPFHEGDTSLTGITAEHWKEVGTIFKRIHQVRPPTSGFESLRKETFDPTGYARWVRAFETKLTHSEGGSVSERVVRSSWVAHQTTIHMMVTIMEKLAGVLQRQTSQHVICHADLHPANLIRDHAGHVFVIDWEDVMLAPKERDFIFVKETQADGSALQGAPPFFQGYGDTEIDWIALTYYRWERVVQDLIECAQNVFFKDNLGEESKRDEAQMLHDSLPEGDNIRAAYEAAAHIPLDLTFHNSDIS